MDTSNGDSAAPVGVDHRKLFVGGLSQDTTEENVREYFGKYGTIESLNLKTDSNTGNSRGFAFIVFAGADALEAIIAVPEHTISGKKIDVQKAKTKQGKLFVGGITPELSEEDIKTHFSQFGPIVSAEFPMDKTKNERKKFCFITFENEQAAKDILKTRQQTIGSVTVDVKRAVAKDQGGRGGGQRGRGGRGGFGGNDWNQGGYGGGYGGGWDQGYGGGWDQGYGGYGNGYNNGFNNGFQGKQRGAGGGRGGRGGRGRGARQQPY